MTKNGMNRRDMTFAGRVREAARALSRPIGDEQLPRCFTPRSLADQAGVQSYLERAKIHDAIRDFVRRGEFVRVGRGLYRYVVQKKPPTIRQRLWDVIRRFPNPSYCLDDLEQLTGVNRLTVRDFTEWLVREGYAERVRRGEFRRVKKMGIEAPRAEYKARKAGRTKILEEKLEAVEGLAAWIRSEIEGEKDGKG